MSLAIEIEDGRGGTKVKAKVTPQGQLVVAPLEFNKPYFQSLDTTDTAFTFIRPVAGKQFVIDAVVVSADRNVSATTAAHVILFEADAEDSTTSLNTIFHFDLVKNTRQALSQLNTAISSGVWLNATTDDTTVNITILGYYIDERG